jgi:hypothetical protein
MRLALSEFTLLFGDIHNHNAHGYGVGSIERSIDVARTHLDFFAFTGHSSWHDLGIIEGGREQHFVRGFERLRETWAHVQAEIANANDDGTFNAFLGFEWHSNFFGDQCVIFPTDYQPLYAPDTLSELRQFCLKNQALMIPHHLAYPRGRRGANWSEFTSDCTPVVEIYSWHGNSEDDRGPYPMVAGSPGGRDTRNTVMRSLADGRKFGFVASSDNHAAFPGGYGEGVMAALATDRTRAAIMEAIHSRRTYALTGDRIEIDFDVDGAAMGSSIEAGEAIAISFDVRARDEIEVVEVIANGEIVHRSYPSKAEPSSGQPIQVRFEWGWGPWPSLGIMKTADWNFTLSVERGEIRRFFPCLQSGPFDETRRHRLSRVDSRSLEVVSYTSRVGAFRENPNQSVILEIRADDDAQLSVVMNEPSSLVHTTTLTEVMENSQNYHVGPYPTESFQWHRALTADVTRVTEHINLSMMAEQIYVYIRVKQRNGHMAWTSPIFINYR